MLSLKITFNHATSQATSACIEETRSTFLLTLALDFLLTLALDFLLTNFLHGLVVGATASQSRFGEQQYLGSGGGG